MTASKFLVYSPNNKLLFSTSSAGTVIGSEKLVLTGQGGVSVKWVEYAEEATIVKTGRRSLATKAVRSPAGHSLSMESTTSSLSLLAPAGVSVSSLSGAVQVAALMDIKMRARGHNSQVSNAAWKFAKPLDRLPPTSSKRNVIIPTNSFPVEQSS